MTMIADMPDHHELREAFELGKTAGRIARAQASESPYSHQMPTLRQAWMDGFSSGRSDRSTLIANQKEEPALGLSDIGRRPVPFGSKVSFHHSTKTVAVEFAGLVKTLGPYTDEDAAYDAAFAFVEMERGRKTSL